MLKIKKGKHRNSLLNNQESSSTDVKNDDNDTKKHIESTFLIMELRPLKDAVPAQIKINPL